jgi:hypothetical protein
MLNKGKYAMLRPAGWAIACLSAVMFPTTAQAGTLVLDWGSVSGIDANATNNYTVGDGQVTVDFLNPENFSDIPFEGEITPAINTVLNGANPDDDPSLHLQIDPEEAGGSVTKQTRFSGFAKEFVDITFTIFDVDIATNNSWQDLVTLTGIGKNGAVNPIFEIEDASVVAEAGNQLKGITNANNSSNRGNVKVYFSDISGFDLTFADGPDIFGVQQNHGIGIGDIHVAVPEPVSVLALLTVGTVLVGGALQKKRVA